MLDPVLLLLVMLPITLLGDAGMEMGKGRRQAGSCQEGAGAARAEEWLRAEEGALELDFLSSGGMGFVLPSPRRRRLRGRWNTNGTGACHGGPGHPEPLLGQAVGSEAAQQLPLQQPLGLFHSGGVGAPQDLPLGGRGLWRHGGDLAIALRGCW